MATLHFQRVSPPLTCAWAALRGVHRLLEAGRWLEACCGCCFVSANSFAWCGSLRQVPLPPCRAAGAQRPARLLDIRLLRAGRRAAKLKPSGGVQRHANESL